MQEDSTWYNAAPIKFESLVFFDAAIIMGGFALCEFFITEIIPLNIGYKITLIGDYWFIRGRNYSIPSTRLPFPNWSERQSFDMFFIPDGDYMDVYLDSLDNHFATFAKVDNVVLEELQRLLDTNTCDLTNVQWPRRADGSMGPPKEKPNITITPKPIEESFDTASDTESQLPVQNNSKKSDIPLWASLAIIGGAVVIAGAVVLFLLRRKK